MAKKKTEQFTSTVFIKFKNEEQFTQSIRKIGLDREGWASSNLSMVANSYHYIRSRLQVRFDLESNNDETEKFIQEVLGAIEGEVALTAETFCFDEQNEMWGWYYLGRKVHEFHKKGNDAFKYFMTSLANIEEWVDEFKQTLCTDELTVLSSIVRAVCDEEFVIENDCVLLEYAGDGGVVNIPDTVVEISNDAFGKTKDSITAVTIPAGVKIIKQDTFSFAENLESVTLFNGLQKIESEAFAGCPKLKSILIPSSVTRISADAFVFGNTEVIYREDDCLASVDDNFNVEMNEEALGYIKVRCDTSLNEIIAQFIIDELINMHMSGANIPYNSDDETNCEKVKEIWLNNKLSCVSFADDGLYIKTTTTDEASLVLAAEMEDENSYYDSFTGDEIESIAKELISRYPGAEVYAKFEYQGNAYYFISVVETVNGEIVACKKEW